MIGSQLLYGYCPICGAPGYNRERRLNGNDMCEKGHKYPSKDATREPKITEDNIVISMQKTERRPDGGYRSIRKPQTLDQIEELFDIGDGDDSIVSQLCRIIRKLLKEKQCYM